MEVTSLGTLERIAYRFLDTYGTNTINDKVSNNNILIQLQTEDVSEQHDNPSPNSISIPATSDCSSPAFVPNES